MTSFDANAFGTDDFGGVIDGTFYVGVKQLTVNVIFPNAVDNKAIAYQDMQVVVSGGDLANAITIDLGADASKTEITEANKTDATYEAKFINGAYVVEVVNALTENIAYNVTVSGAGYRTARYTVTMTDNKELTFWNNVMDNDAYIEEGQEIGKGKLNFLAGDILEDNKINIYDLSAVVSYFGKTGNTTNGYAQYDLNRDTVVDSKDVAYVLVSWDK